MELLEFKSYQIMPRFHQCCITSTFKNKRYAHVDKPLCVINREGENQAMI